MIEDYDNEDYDYFKEWDIEQAKLEIERLNNIINKVRNKTIEMINNNSLDFMYRLAYKDILEILDKVGDKE